MLTGMQKVRVQFKNPIDKKTEVMWMKGKQVEWYRKNRDASPYKRITVLKK